MAMYHDLVPMNLLAFDRIKAFTIDIPILFCSVGHATANDIAGKGITSTNSFIESLQLLSTISKNTRAVE
ncbi:hypothetical protein GCM10025859_18330 [Alicyclobacillus fastidiosus]|nr:hypothetical protein GCM10025859_18330 [Alicyclobacillus fastidiosus]